jgi:hypothetical protein
MKKMERFEVIDYGFAKRPDDDARLKLEGKDFNDYHFGSGWNRKEALQMAIELIEEHGVQASKKLVKEMEKADIRTSVKDVQWELAVRFYFDRTAEDAEIEARMQTLIADRKSLRQAIIDAGGFPEDAQESVVVRVAA